MRIALAEIRGDKKLANREFTQTVLKIGRDKLRCDVVFDQDQWPMVSRVHAELRLHEGRCYLADLGSRHGTFINGQRITTATELQTGARFQLGPQGPILSLDLINDLAKVPDFSKTFIDSGAAKEQAALRARAQEDARVRPLSGATRNVVDPPTVDPGIHSRPPQLPEQPAGRSVPKTEPVLVCESGSPTQLGLQFPLKHDKTLLGRDVASDIKIDAVAAVVSRRHAEIQRRADGAYLISDLKSFNGTLLNQQLISKPETLYHGDQIQLGAGGPILRFIDHAHPAQRPKLNDSMRSSGQYRRNVGAVSSDNVRIKDVTIAYRPDTDQLGQQTPIDTPEEQFLFQLSFDGKNQITVGRGTENDIRLDGLVISKYHARFINTPAGVMVEEASATNGVYLNGGRVSGRQRVEDQDVVQIGPFVLKVEAQVGIAVFDTRAKTRIDAIDITQKVRRGSRKLLDQISLAINANEFVGVLGPSGSGKSTLINVLNGMHRASEGRVLINHLDLYQHIDSLKQSIGYVPQDDIIHRQLTVYRTLYYVARLRLSRDVRKNEIDQIIGEVLDVTGLTARRDFLVSQLSGGQRKRVSIAVELMTKPSVIFLDEPTSGLDPATEERIMKLFRQIAESGRTVVLTTHAMENVRLFDKVALLMGGRLIFYGKPAEVLKFVGANNFIELYTKIEEPIHTESAKLGPASALGRKAELRAYEVHRSEIAETVAEDWRRRFKETEESRRYLSEPLSHLRQGVRGIPPPRRRRSVIDAVLQWITLVRRYSEVLANDKWNLLILFGQAPIIAFLTYLVVDKNDPRDFPYFILALVAIWFGTSVAARELVKERPIFRRERMVNLRLLPYIASKLWVLSFIVGLQATLLFIVLKVFHFAGLMNLPGLLFGVPQLFVLVLTGIVGITVGLFVSAVVRTSEVATSLIPLILIPQILFAGLIAVPAGLSKVVGATMPATWSFDEIKRLSTLDTLKEEGSDPDGPNKGRGLYNHIKDLNKENIEKTRKEMDDYRQQSSRRMEDYARQVEIQSTRVATARSNKNPAAPTIDPPPPVPNAIELPEDLSRYVSFMHPWGGHIVNIAILFAMLFTLMIATLVALKTQDTR